MRKKKPNCALDRSGLVPITKRGGGGLLQSARFSCHWILVSITPNLSCRVVLYLPSYVPIRGTVHHVHDPPLDILNPHIRLIFMRNENGATAGMEDLEEKLVTSKLGGGSGAPSGDDNDFGHDKL
ncbi:hypothetical protein C8R44DRAFT_745178 [Mycena epipterygia]|nr:hypothetical protein C8R44DRAFT_745178 [Mycena epipterygia]